MRLTIRQRKAATKLHSLDGGAVWCGPALVDASDFAMLAKYTWHINHGGYARTCVIVDGRKKYILMHKLILGSTSDQITDHKNQIKLDNRRENLRIVDASVNGYNRKTVGIRQLKSGKWHARIFVDGKEVNLGTYPTESWAKKANLQAKAIYAAN